MSKTIILRHFPLCIKFLFSKLSLTIVEKYKLLQKAKAAGNNPLNEREFLYFNIFSIIYDMPLQGVHV